MDRFHRYYALHGVLAARRLPVSRRELESKLECSRATVKRLVEDLRGYGVPIRYERWHRPAKAFGCGLMLVRRL